MDNDTAPPKQFTFIATPNGIVLSTPNGQFLLQSTVGDTSNDIDPVDLFGIQDSDPHALVLQTGQVVL